MEHIEQCVKQLKAYRGFLPVYLEDELFNKAEKELEELKAIQVQAKVKPACEQLERDIKCLLVDVETQLSKCPYGKPRRLLLYMQEQIKAILTEYESKSV